jgi:hypothetical protein
MCFEISDILKPDQSTNSEYKFGFLQVPAPFGVNIGGTNPAFWQVKPEVKYDSWLTVGVTTGNVHNDISSIGIDWDSWTEKEGLTADDGVRARCILQFRSEVNGTVTHPDVLLQAVFWMDPGRANCV